MTEIFLAIIAGYCVGVVAWEIEEAVRRAVGRRRSRIYTVVRRARHAAFIEANPGAWYDAVPDAWHMPDGSLMGDEHAR